MNPVLSIVIANYNYGRFIEEAILSVLNQEVGNQVELIICDGGSTDNSVEIIKKYANGLPPNTSLDTNSQPQTTNITWWCSEKDSGQSAAFNKGFDHARGKYITWLNADDFLPMGCLKKICRELQAYPKCDWFTGNFYRFDDTTRRVKEVCWGPNYYPTWLQMKMSPLVIYGPSAFFSKAAYDKVGKIDESYHYAMDTDLWTRFIVRGIKQRRIRVFCWGFRMHGDSKTEGDEHVLSLGAKLMAEHERTRESTGYSPSIIMKIIVAIWRIMDGSYVYSHCLRNKMLGTIIKNGG